MTTSSNPLGPWEGKAPPLGNVIRVPSPGRIVHYVAPLDKETMTCWPAIVRRTRNRMAATLGAGDGFFVDLSVFGADGYYDMQLVPYDPDEKKLWTWHWPESVVVEIEVRGLDRPMPLESERGRAY